MQPFSAELLSILALVAIVVAGVSLLLLLVVIIYLCCSRRQRSRAIEPETEHSNASSDHEDEESASVALVVSPKPAPKSTIKYPKRARTPVDAYLSEPHSEIEEVTVVPHRNGKKQQHPPQNQHRHMGPQRDDSPKRVQGRPHDQFHPQRTKLGSRSVVDTRFPERHTPYPPDVMRRERMMMDHIQFPEKYWNVGIWNSCCWLGLARLSQTARQFLNRVDQLWSLKEEYTPVLKAFRVKLITLLRGNR